jgi:hypothetical protein
VSALRRVLPSVTLPGAGQSGKHHDRQVGPVHEPFASEAWTITLGSISSKSGPLGHCMWEGVIRAPGGNAIIHVLALQGVSPLAPLRESEREGGVTHGAQLQWQHCRHLCMSCKQYSKSLPLEFKRAN